jgi:hypothetical protein
MMQQQHEPSWKRFEKFEGITEEEERQARVQMRNRGRAQRVLRNLSKSDAAGQWGVSRHRGAGKNWH